MQDQKTISCQCGTVEISLSGAPILSGECVCNSCRGAGAMMQSLKGAPQILSAYGGTTVIVFRKDRLRVQTGEMQLKEFRLNPKSKTRRVIATCCNTPMMIEYTPGHWYSLYAHNFAPEDRPPVESRSFTASLPDPSILPQDTVNAKTVTAGFIFKMLASFALMGFRKPKTRFIHGTVDMQVAGVDAAKGAS